VSRRLFADWRFAVSLGFLIMVSYLVLTGVVAIQQNAEKGRQIDALVTASHRADADASRQRDALLDSQARLLARLDAYDARQRALLAYLRAHGVQIPVRYVVAPRTPGGGNGVTRSPNAPHKPSSGPIFNQPPPSIAAPGNSSGHRHHPKKPHKHQPRQ